MEINLKTKFDVGDIVKVKREIHRMDVRSSPHICLASFIGIVSAINFVDEKLVYIIEANATSVNVEEKEIVSKIPEVLV